MNSFLSAITHNGKITLQIIRRDLKELRVNIVTLMIDNLCMLGVIVFTFGYLMPYMGMAINLIGPMFIGQVLTLLINLGFALSTKLIQDIKFDKFIEYQLGLPISSNWLIASYIVSFVIRASILILPLLGLGALFLGSSFIVYKTNWPAFLLIYILIGTFVGALFMLFSFTYDYKWFWQSIWARRIDPLYLLSSMFFIWKVLHTHAPTFSKILLLNPLTYVSEGVRATLIGSDQYIPALYCALALFTASIITIYQLKIQMKKTLDYL